MHKWVQTCSSQYFPTSKVAGKARFTSPLSVASLLPSTHHWVPGGNVTTIDLRIVVRAHPIKTLVGGWALLLWNIWQLIGKKHPNIWKFIKFHILTMYFHILTIYFHILTMYFYILTIYFHILTMYFHILTIYFHILTMYFHILTIYFHILTMYFHILTIYLWLTHIKTCSKIAKTNQDRTCHAAWMFDWARHWRKFSCNCT